MRILHIIHLYEVFWGCRFNPIMEIRKDIGWVPYLEPIEELRSSVLPLVIEIVSLEESVGNYSLRCVIREKWKVGLNFICILNTMVPLKD